MEEKGEGGRPVAVLPPLDLHILQSKVAGGRLPPGYGLRDEYNCIKLALCQLCSSRLPATHEALKQHVECARHQAKLGRVIVDQRTLEEFRAGGTPHQPRDEKEGEEDGERFAIRLCTACEEDGTLVPAIGKCKECEDFLCQPCKDAHSKTRLQSRTPWKMWPLPSSTILEEMQL